ncbi:MAG: histidine phosphatase family protein, partial [Blastochloris sp.]|nr:histidine phosphatase family protein [Blastochloris sp.]
MITLWLVRHGVTDWNEQKRYQGHSDIGLNDTGKRQAQQIAQRLASEKLHVIFSSDLTRAMETAEIIAAPHKLTIQPEPNFRETNFGLFEGL